MPKRSVHKWVSKCVHCEYCDSHYTTENKTKNEKNATAYENETWPTLGVQEMTGALAMEPLATLTKTARAHEHQGGVCVCVCVCMRTCAMSMCICMRMMPTCTRLLGGRWSIMVVMVIRRSSCFFRERNCGRGKVRGEGGGGDGEKWLIGHRKGLSWRAV